MTSEPSPLKNWTPAEVALGSRWVQAGREAGQEMEHLRREELRRSDVDRAIASVRARRIPRPSAGAAADFRAGGATAMVQESCRP